MKNFFFGSLFGFLALLAILILCLCMCFFMFTASIAQLFSSDSSTGIAMGSDIYSLESGSISSQNKILIINVEGVILNEEPADPLSSLLSSGVVYGYSIKQEFMEAAKDSTIKGIILRVNSPGGTITGAKAIADGIEYYKEVTGNSVVGFGSGLVASGGYWAISGADQIFLDEGSTVGSIGVILGPLTRYRNVVGNDQVLTQDGITEEYITSGKGKDIGNPYRDLTAEERDTLQKSVSDSYEVFVNKVASDRGIDVNKVKTDIGAYIFGDKQSLDLNLVDQIANKEEVINSLVSELGLGEDYQIIKKEQQYDFFSALLGVSVKNSGLANVENICNKVNTALVIDKSYIQSCSK